MTTNKWTPGPWVAERNRSYWEVKPVNDRGDGDIPYSIGDVCASDPHDRIGLQEANARLIAAAPDLYTALEAILERYTQLCENGCTGVWDCEDETEVKLARAAMIAARGAAE